MLNYMNFRGFHQGNLFCHSDKSPVSYYWYKSRFAVLVKLADLDPALTTHSARVGAATYAATAGYSEEEIKRMGRWVSSAVKSYIKLPIITF